MRIGILGGTGTAGRALADELRRRGIARAAGFTWQRAAEGLAAALRVALERASARSSAA
jgi:putative NADH-flavin reductase